MASPLTDSHLPSVRSRSWNIGQIVPSFVGPTFIRTFPETFLFYSSKFKKLKLVDVGGRYSVR